MEQLHITESCQLKYLVLETLPPFQTICCFSCWPKDLKIKLHRKPIKVGPSLLDPSFFSLGDGSGCTNSNCSRTTWYLLGASLRLWIWVGPEIWRPNSSSIGWFSMCSSDPGVVVHSSLGRYVTDLGLHSWRVSSNILDAILQWLSQVNSLSFYSAPKAPL